MKTQIHIHIENNGNVKVVDILGAGAGCQALFSGLENALGVVDEKSRETTAAAYEQVDPLKLNVALD